MLQASVERKRPKAIVYDKGIEIVQGSSVQGLDTTYTSQPHADEHLSHRRRQSDGVKQRAYG